MNRAVRIAVAKVLSSASVSRSQNRSTSSWLRPLVGMRISESLGLRWKHVDTNTAWLDETTIMLHNGVVRQAEINMGGPSAEPLGQCTLGRRPESAIGEHDLAFHRTRRQ